MDATNPSFVRPSEAPPPAFAQPAESADTRGTALASDFETFLRMLTVQMQNQDPLEPDSASDFAVQLATFSTVEQQVLTNDLLAGLDARFSAMNLAQMSGWIGMEAQAPLAARFAGNPVSFAFSPDAKADAATLVAVNALGAEVQRLPIDPQSGAGTWQGISETGASFPEGTYELTVESFAGDTFLGEQRVRVYAPVVEVQQTADGGRVIFENGANIPAGEVTGLRAPGA